MAPPLVLTATGFLLKQRASGVDREHRTDRPDEKNQPLWWRLANPSSPSRLRMLENSGVSPTLDPEGAHLAALRRLADFRGARVLEMGCGDGRLTEGITRDAAHVLAFDPDREAVEQACKALPADLADQVSFRVSSAEQLEIPPGSFDLVVFSWSL